MAAEMPGYLHGAGIRRAHRVRRQWARRNSPPRGAGKLPGPPDAPLPYDKSIARPYVHGPPSAYAARCYIVVIQDVRGTAAVELEIPQRTIRRHDRAALM